jgi:hypothetical protein
MSGLAYTGQSFDIAWSSFSQENAGPEHQIATPLRRQAGARISAATLERREVSSSRGCISLLFRASADPALHAVSRGRMQ